MVKQAAQARPRSATPAIASNSASLASTVVVFVSSASARASTSSGGTAYEVTPWECECHAGPHNDPVCKHRAALRFVLGALKVDRVPEPTPPRATVVARGAEVPCHNCDGHGWGSTARSPVAAPTA